MISSELLSRVYNFHYEGTKSAEIPKYMFVNRVLARLEALPEAAVKEYCFPLFMLLRLVKVELEGNTRNCANCGCSILKSGATTIRSTRSSGSTASANSRAEHCG